MDDLPPVNIGASGLTGRPQVRPVVEEEFETDPETGWAVLPPPRRSSSMPANCLRVLNSPLSVDRGGGCNTDCQGRQRDGGCLCDIVRAANEQGVEWVFEVNYDGAGVEHWDYVGPPLST